MRAFSDRSQRDFRGRLVLLHAEWLRRLTPSAGPQPFPTARLRLQCFYKFRRSLLLVTVLFLSFLVSSFLTSSDAVTSLPNFAFLVNARGPPHVSFSRFFLERVRVSAARLA